MNKGDWGNRLKKVEQLAQSFQQCPLSSRYKPRLSRPWQPSSIWKLFPRQCMAINFGQSCREDVHVFALEKEQAKMGQRIFLVTSYSELWHYYSTYRQSLMHCYEVIPEGAVCKLYFDLEFHRPSNKGFDGKCMVASLIQYVCEKLEEVYGIECSGKDVLNLDSSTEEKFSRHLIFILPNAAFKDNLHVGHFIHFILQPVLSMQRRGSELENDVGGVTEDSDKRGLIGSPQAKRPRQEERDLSFLLVKNKDGQEGLFVDLGVYTKNRNFRLYKSSKVGKNAAFTVAEDNKFITKPKRNVSAEECLFQSSLISNVSFTGQKILTWDLHEERDGICPKPHAQLGSTSHCVSDSLGGYQCSPHKEVDNFVLSVVKKDGIQGSIRRWNYFVSEQLLVYDILKYRWCQNVDRFHKSNNIMILVDLKEEVWYQKCHDPACKSFRSSSYPLPQDICLSYLITMDEEDQAYLMDDVGNIELSQTPPAEKYQGGSAATLPQGEGRDPWGDKPDDQAYLEALEDVERNTGDLAEDDVPDELLLQTMTEFESLKDLCLSGH
ncbi:DNA-directed primase/polymerase protein [Coregonus clupeaformis]|uniref:DNA-directed primase/polymerase protein n=1 Tax=Coregonus clupeaformis TaxID=59861 RepID=UPI001E1C5456|nr:DNA-directed primase/polymerase protein [Coregonus clupeaformis]